MDSEPNSIHANSVGLNFSLLVALSCAFLSIIEQLAIHHYFSLISLYYLFLFSLYASFEIVTLIHYFLLSLTLNGRNKNLLLRKVRVELIYKKISLAKLVRVLCCLQYRQLLFRGVTRFRGMISTQPGSTSVSSFKITSLEETEPTLSSIAGNHFGPFGEQDDEQVHKPLAFACKSNPNQTTWARVLI